MENVCSFLSTQINSAIHKAAGRAVPGFAWYNSCGTEKCPLAVNGSRWQERPPEVVLYGGRPYGGFVNSAVNRLRLKVFLVFETPETRQYPPVLIFKRVKAPRKDVLASAVHILKLERYRED